MDNQPENTTPTAPPGKLEVTEAAAKHITHLLVDEPADAKFRISVLGGGCAGFQYNFEIDPKPEQQGDILVRNGDAIVVIDDVSLGLLGGSVLDYVENMIGATFEIKNPNAVAGCGCGNSFSIG